MAGTVAQCGAGGLSLREREGGGGGGWGIGEKAGREERKGEWRDNRATEGVCERQPSGVKPSTSLSKTKPCTPIPLPPIPLTSPPSSTTIQVRGGGTSRRRWDRLVR